MRQKMRKETLKYYFSVEGETEQQYLKWLEKTINETEDKKYRVRLDSKVQKNPLTRVKSMNILKKTEITHIFDYESEEKEYRDRFRTTLDKMKEAEQGKKIEYHLGYCNLTFELWMILHKKDCNVGLSDRRNYLAYLNKAYQEDFVSLTEYKRKSDFKRVLEKLDIEDVFQAIERSKEIVKKNQENGYKPEKYKGFEYYRENPSLSLWEVIEKILKKCGLKSKK